MKRRRLKKRFWVVLAILILSIASCIGGCQKGKETAKIIECDVASAECSQAKEHILAIPMEAELQEQLYEAAQEFGVDYYIMIALIDRETEFRNVFGDGGDSYGYCQIQPKWWYGLMVDIGATNLTNPRDNFRVACAIIAQLTEEYQSVEGALVAYNQGSYNGSSTEYSREIIANARRYRA